MLYKESVEQSTLELILHLQEKDYLQGFYLVGGTALALRMGYRESIDIDLFSNFSFDAVQMLDNLSTDFPFQLFFSANNTLKGSINNVKIDILAHRYPIIGEVSKIENISIMSDEDIVAMKLNAISVSGQRVKDFIDLYYLLDKYSVAEMITFYKKKYKQYNETNVLKSITWFDDVDLSDWPVLLKTPKLKWETVKKRIIEASSIFLSQI